jgi:hypothetical protein
MNYVRKISASLLATLLLVSLCSAVSRSHDKRSQARVTEDHATTNGAVPQKKNVQAKPDVMSAEEKLVRDVYARLMRYQSASRDVADDQQGTQSAPQDFLTFELGKIHAGPVTEIYDRPLRDLVTPQASPLLNIKPVYLAPANGPQHAYYEAEWAGEPGAQPAAHTADSDSTGPAVKNIRGIAAFNGYTAYEVRVHFRGKVLSYRALALYRNSAEQLSGRPSRVEILDNVTSGMTAVYNDEAPVVRAPWAKYVKTGLYRAVAASIKAKKETGKQLRPDDAPIGYLPGDDAVAEYAINNEQPLQPIDGGGGGDDGGGGGGGGGTTCTSSVSLTHITAVGKDYTRFIGVTIDPAATITLTLSTTTGTGSAVFTSNNSTSMTVSQTTNVEIKGVTTSSTKNNIKLTATQNGSSVASTTFTVIQVTISMTFTGTVSSDNAGKTAYSSLLGTSNLGSFLSGGSNPNHIWRNGVQFTGTILPANFDGAVTLNRLVERVINYNDQTQREDKCPCGDTSDPVLRDDDPQSGSSGGKVYDLDAPGLGVAPSAPVGTVLRTRINFHMWATVDGDNRVSADFQWFSRQSVTKTASGDQLINDVSGDNVIGPGATTLTWNLQ